MMTNVAGYTNANVDGRVQGQSYVNGLKMFESMLVKWSSTVARRTCCKHPSGESLSRRRMGREVVSSVAGEDLGSCSSSNNSLLPVSRECTRRRRRTW